MLGIGVFKSTEELLCHPSYVFILKNETIQSL